MLPNGQPLKGGSILSDELVKIIGPKNVEDHVRNGLLIPLGSERDTEQNDTGVDPNLKPIKSEVTDDGRTLRTFDKPGTPKPQQPKGRWNYDPKFLKGKSLEDLNRHVIEIDHTIVPFQTKEEAIAQLSTDFRS